MSHNWNDGTEQYNIEGKLRRANERIADLERELATSHEERKAMFERMGAENARLLNEREQLRVACFTVKNYLNRLEGLPEDDPLLAMRRHFHAPLHKALDAALSASEPSSTPAK